MSAAAPPHLGASVSTARTLGAEARADSRVRSTSAAALWASLLLVTYWWMADGGVEALGAGAEALTSIGRLTGLLAADLLLAQVLLMARLPILERAYGRDRLVRIHRVIGFTSFNLMVAHIVLITWGYAAGQLAQSPRTLWTMTWDYPGMLLAMAGTACLVLSVVTSIRAARARMRYESWHLLHLYAYLGVGLALPHQLWTGQSFTSSQAASIFWWGLWAAAAGSIMIWRVLLPLWRSLRHRLRVTSVVQESSDTYSVYMTGRRLDLLQMRAGEFGVWRFLGTRGWTRANPYSLSAAPDGRSLRITVKSLGDNSGRVPRIRPGARVVLEGPYGRLTARTRTKPGVALIGAGVGVAPLRSLAEGLSYAPGDAVLLHRFSGEPLFYHELEALGRERGLRVLWLPGRRRSASSWLGDGVGDADDATALRYWVPDIHTRDVYVCGPDDWTASVIRSCRKAGVRGDQIHIEIFGW